MLGTEEKVAVLAKGVFEHLGSDALMTMAGRMGERVFEDGQLLFLEGQPGDEMFVVISGAVEVFRGEQVIALIGPGELTGEMAILGTGKRTASGRARGTTHLLFLKGKALKLLIQKTPDIAFAIFSVLVDRLENTNELAFFLASDSPELGLLEVTAGDLAGKSFPLYHESAIVGKSRGSMLGDALRVVLPSSDPELQERHACITVADDSICIEPLEGKVTVDGEPITSILQLGDDDEVGIGGLRLRVRRSGE